MEKNICKPGNFIIKDDTCSERKRSWLQFLRGLFTSSFSSLCKQQFFDSVTSSGVLWSKTLVCHCIQAPETSVWLCMRKTGATGFSGTQTLNFVNVSVTTVAWNKNVSSSTCLDTKGDLCWWCYSNPCGHWETNINRGEKRHDIQWMGDHATCFLQKLIPCLWFARSYNL